MIRTNLMDFVVYSLVVISELYHISGGKTWQSQKEKPNMAEFEENFLKEREKKIWQS